MFFDGNGPESGGCNVLDQVQANCWTEWDARSLGLCMAHVTLTAAIRECADGGGAEDGCGCWPVLVVASCRIVERVAERNCGCTTGREEGVRSRGSSSGLQGNEIQSVSPFSIALIAAIWSGSCMKARLEQSRRAKFE